MALEKAQERRSQSRISDAAISARLRLKGKITRIQVQVVDYNRYGLGVLLDRPLSKDQLVYLTLTHPGAAASTTMALERVIGVVHNCLVHDQGYRCGIRFRTESSLQFDRNHVEAALADLEATLQEG